MINACDLSEARFEESVKCGEVLTLMKHVFGR